MSKANGSLGGRKSSNSKSNRRKSAGGKSNSKSAGKSKIPQGINENKLKAGGIPPANQASIPDNMPSQNPNEDRGGMQGEKVGNVQGGKSGVPKGGKTGGKASGALNMASNAAKMGLGALSKAGKGGQGGQQGDNNTTVPDINDKKGGAKNAAGKAANKASQASDKAKKVIDMAKKISKKANSGVAKIGKAIGKIASKLGPALPYVAIAVVIIIVIIGICGFLATMPGMMTGKLKAFAQAVANWWQSIYMSSATANVDKEDIIDTAKYIKDMGYDLIGYGFIPAKEISTSSSESGSYYDKYGICYTATTGEEKGATGTFEVSGSVTDFHEDVDTSVLELYLMSNNRLYTIRNYDWNNTPFEAFITAVHDTFVFNGIDYGKGIISLWHSNESFEAANPYNKLEMGEISVNMETKEMEITKGWFNNPMKFKMDGWSGRYGLSLEFLLSLHLATMAPDLPKTIARTFDTEIQVYLIEYEEAKITGYYKNDDGDYVGEAEMNQADMNGQDSDTDISGITSIDANDAHDIMYECGIKSQEKGDFICEYAIQFVTRYAKDSEDVDVDSLNSYQEILESESDETYYHQNVIWGRSGDGTDEFETLQEADDWLDFFNNSSSRTGEEIILETLGGSAILDIAANFFFDNYSLILDPFTSWATHEIIWGVWQSTRAGVALSQGKSVEELGEPWSLDYELFNTDKRDLRDWILEVTKEESEKGGYNLELLISNLKDLDSIINKVKARYPDYVYYEQEENEDNIYDIVEKDISEFQNNYKLNGDESKENVAKIYDELLPISELRQLNDSNTEVEIGTFYEKGDVETRKKVRISLVVGRTSGDHNYDMTIVAYDIPSDSEIAELADKKCSDLLYTDQLRHNERYEVCKGCEKYVEIIRNAIYAISDTNYAGYAPVIARVVDSWFRDTYFIVPGTADKAIENVYNSPTKQNDYGTEMLLTSGNIEYVEVDNEYLEKTDEYWTKYETDGNGNYKLYLLNEDGTLNLTGPTYTAIKSEKNEVIEYVASDGSDSLDPKSEEARKLVKKPVTQNISSAWQAYTVATHTGESEPIPLQVKNDTNKNIKKVSHFITENDYDQVMHYTTTGIPKIEQQEDGRRGITNKTIKKMFKIRKYYIYDGTSEKAEAIYKNWQEVKNIYGTAAYNKYGSIIENRYDLINSSSNTNSVQDKIRNEVTDLALEWAIDDFYYNNDTSLFSEDPRNLSLIGNITINKDTLNAFSILENIDTIDSDYQYRDFKELIVELNYFDKEDLSDKSKEIFTWIMPEYTDKWPIRMIDKSEEYYGTLIHSAKATTKLKTLKGLASEEEIEVSVEGAEENREQMIDLANSTGYAAGLEVVSPVTGKIVSYGQYERINTDMMENVPDITEEAATETVGYVQIKVLSEEEFPDKDNLNFFNSTNMPGQGTTEVDGENITKNLSEVWNSYYKEYVDVCDGYYVTIDGIDISGIDFDNLVASTNIKPVITPNLVDDGKEKENQAIENIKADAFANPAFVKIGGDVYIREGTIIGRTLDDTDYSYTRIILRDDELAVKENVEKYFNLPETMMTNLGGVSVEFAGLSDNPSDQEKVRVAVTYLKSQGYTTEAACGIVGNLIQECNLDPTCVTDRYRGLAQWHDTDLWPGIYQWMQDNGYNEDSFEGQLRAICESPASIDNIYHYDGGKDKYWNDLKALTDEKQAAEAFCVYYERCVYGDDSATYYTTGYAASYKFQDLNKRKLFAENAYKIYMGNDTLSIKAGE